MVEGLPISARVDGELFIVLPMLLLPMLLPVLEEGMAPELPRALPGWPVGLVLG